MTPLSESVANRQFAEELRRDLEALREGTARELPGLDCTPLPLLGRIAALAGLYRRFNRETLYGLGSAGVEEQVLGILRSRAADTPGALAAFTHQTRAGMTRTLDRLESRGLIRRRADPGDRRRTRVSLTLTGRDCAERKLRAQIQALHAILRGLDREAHRRLSNALDELIARLAAVPRSAQPAADTEQRP